MNTLYPEIEPFATFHLPVGDGHTLYIEQCGNPRGLPVVFLHGGPGGGLEAYHRRFFDPAIYHIVLFDQRGCGKSTPHAELKANTTWHLVEDIETIRKHLNIDHWLVFGGSWGSTLALAYAETHPDRVLGLVLRGIFLCRPEDIHWFYQHGASRLFPDLWQHFIEPIPETERHDLLQACYRRLTGDDEVERLRVARAWSVWEGATLSLETNPAIVNRFADTHTALSIARIESHYFVNNIFMEQGQLLADVSKIRHLPGVIVHGRYDVICPMDGAWALHQAWPESELNIVGVAGHSASEPGITDALVAATRSMAARLA